MKNVRTPLFVRFRKKRTVDFDFEFDVVVNADVIFCQMSEDLNHLTTWC